VGRSTYRSLFVTSSKVLSLFSQKHSSFLKQFSILLFSFYFEPLQEVIVQATSVGLVPFCSLGYCLD
jgi:hypothetical protein